MQKTILAIVILMSNLSAALAQGTNEVAENTTYKSQQKIMDDFNAHSRVNLKFYPNPALSYLIVEPELNSEAGEIRVMDVTGKVAGAYHLEPGSNGLSIDLSNYYTGLYVLAFYDDQNHLLNVSRFNKE